jgi:RNA polymerase sigma factor (sigma-70 family)
LTPGSGAVGPEIPENLRTGRLTEALRNNEDWAVAEVSRRIEPIIKNKIYSFDDWEDVLQQSLMEVVVAVKACATINSLWGLVRRVTITSVIDHNRRFQKSRERTSRRAIGGGDESEIPTVQLLDRRSSADAVLESRDLFLYIYQRIGQKCRKIIDLVYIEGVTYERAAEVLGIKEGNLRVSIHRCRDRAMQLGAEATQLQ